MVRWKCLLHVWKMDWDSMHTTNQDFLWEFLRLLLRVDSLSHRHSFCQFHSHGLVYLPCFFLRVKWLTMNRIEKLCVISLLFFDQRFVKLGIQTNEDCLHDWYDDNLHASRHCLPILDRALYLNQVEYDILLICTTNKSLDFTQMIHYIFTLNELEELVSFVRTP